MLENANTDLLNVDEPASPTVVDNPGSQPSPEEAGWVVGEAAEKLAARRANGDEPPAEAAPDAHNGHLGEDPEV